MLCEQSKSKSKLNCSSIGSHYAAAAAAALLLPLPAPLLQRSGRRLKPALATPAATSTAQPVCNFGQKAKLLLSTRLTRSSTRQVLGLRWQLRGRRLGLGHGQKGKKKNWPR